MGDKVITGKMLLSPPVTLPKPQYLLMATKQSIMPRAHMSSKNYWDKQAYQNKNHYHNLLTR